MAIDFISINLTASTATQAANLKNFISVLRQAQELGQRVLDVMGHMEDGTTFTEIETLFGLPTGQGQNVFNLVNGTMGAMNGTFQNNNAATITKQVG